MDPIRLATCLDRSVAASGAIASTVSPCLPWRKRLALPERPALVESLVAEAKRLAMGREAPASGGSSGGASRRMGLSLQATAGRVGQATRPSARLCGPWRGHGRATRPSWKTIGAGPASTATEIQWRRCAPRDPDIARQPESTLSKRSRSGCVSRNWADCRPPAGGLQTFVAAWLTSPDLRVWAKGSTHRRMTRSGRPLVLANPRQHGSRGATPGIMLTLSLR